MHFAIGKPPMPFIISIRILVKSNPKNHTPNCVIPVSVLALLTCPPDTLRNFSSILGDLVPIANRYFIMEITKWQIAYVPFNPVADFVHMLDLNTWLCVGWKMLPNLKFKLKFQSQISDSNLNFKKLKTSPSSCVFRDSGKLNPMVKGMKPYCYVDTQSLWAAAWYFLHWGSF